MARILGAVASSHTPTIGFALDTHKEHDPAWAPIFEGYKPVQRWLAVKRPDVLLMIFNDHVTSFFFDHYSHFALGIGDSYAPADEGGGARALPPVRGHARLSQHIAAGLVADEFDLSYFQDKPLDHGCFSPLSMLWRIPQRGPARSCRCKSACSNFRSRQRGDASSLGTACARRSTATLRI
jgi:gallate dioxygenase